MLKIKFLIVQVVIQLVVAFSIFAQGAEPHAGMLRFPDVSATQIVFAYAGNLWVVSKEGGVAMPLTCPSGRERFPRFSPDGKAIAFQANYEGNVDIYTIPVAGGIPFRVTHHPEPETPWDWTGDDQLVFYCRGMGSHPHGDELFLVPASGGLPEKLDVPYGVMGMVSSDGAWLAYTPYTRDHLAWKRYRGGMATDIWLFHLKTHQSRMVTDWEGTDTQPMWSGNLLYYLSDAGPDHRLNIWTWDMRTDTKRQVTHYTEDDVKWPAVGPNDIVFQLGSGLHLLDLTTEKTRRVNITIPGDQPKLHNQAINVADCIHNRNISATGKRVVAEARGDIWTVPVHKGSPINLTRTSGVAERDPAWSPDGRWIAYFSDQTGNDELCIIGSDGKGTSRVLSELGSGFLKDPVWSPDSKTVAFWNLVGTLHIADVENGGSMQVYQSPVARCPRVSWASDSNWLTFSDAESIRRPSAILVYCVEEGRLQRVTAGMFNDTWPVFDREGRYLYFST